jgi:hypothetical protein
MEKKQVMLENILIKYGLNLAACNQYFDKLKEQKAEDNAEEMEAFEKLLSNAELSAGR